LVSEGKLTAKEIALELDTTVQNVWKETSLIRSRGELVIRNSIAQQSNKSRMIFLNPAEEQRGAGTLGFNKILHKSTSLLNDLIDIPQLDSEGLKILYREFKSGKKPIDILAEYGFHPEIVEGEYQRFMQLSERDIGDLTKRIILSMTRKGYTEETPRNDKIQALITLYHHRGYLLNNEILDLWEQYTQEEVRDEMDLMVVDTDRRLTKGFSRIRCRVCNSMLPDIILCNKLPLGKKLYDEYDGRLLCEACSDRDQCSNVT
jgi:hypothetical protein